MNWNYSEWFLPALPEDIHPAVLRAERYLIDCHIERHPFFKVASSSRQALKAWVSQEIIVTGFFSQALLRVAAAINNVHARTLMLQVINGEHGRLDGDTARLSHPWLLHKLRASMDIAAETIKPFEETEEFIRSLNRDCVESITGVAALGMGNERLLLPEYSALRRAFELNWPDCDFQGFLDANLTADSEHAHILSRIATFLLSNGADADAYLQAGKRSVDNRIKYHDKLCTRFE